MAAVQAVDGDGHGRVDVDLELAVVVSDARSDPWDRNLKSRERDVLKRTERVRAGAGPGHHRHRSDDGSGGVFDHRGCGDEGDAWAIDLGRRILGLAAAEPTVVLVGLEVQHARGLCVDEVAAELAGVAGVDLMDRDFPCEEEGGLLRAVDVAPNDEPWRWRVAIWLAAECRPCCRLRDLRGDRGGGVEVRRDGPGATAEHRDDARHVDADIDAAFEHRDAAEGLVKGEGPGAPHACADYLLEGRGAEPQQFVLIDQQLVGVAPGLFERVLAPVVDLDAGAIDRAWSARGRVPLDNPIAAMRAFELL